VGLVTLSIVWGVAFAQRRESPVSTKPPPRKSAVAWPGSPLSKHDCKCVNEPALATKSDNGFCGKSGEDSPGCVAIELHAQRYTTYELNALVEDFSSDEESVTALVDDIQALQANPDPLLNVADAVLAPLKLRLLLAGKKTLRSRVAPLMDRLREPSIRATLCGIAPWRRVGLSQTIDLLTSISQDTQKLIGGKKSGAVIVAREAFCAGVQVGGQPTSNIQTCLDKEAREQFRRISQLVTASKQGRVTGRCACHSDWGEITRWRDAIAWWRQNERRLRKCVSGQMQDLLGKLRGGSEAFVAYQSVRDNLNSVNILLDGLDSRKDDDIVKKLSLSDSIVEKIAGENAAEFRCGERAVRSLIITCLSSKCATVAEIETAWGSVNAVCP
jgi:hypothetical protein